MSQEENVERIPLLRGPYRNPNYISNDNRRSFSFSFLGYGFIFAMVLLTSINLAFYFIESDTEVVEKSQSNLPKGNSRIPYQYYLGLKNENLEEFEYVIETSPPSDPTFSNLFINEEKEEGSQLRLAEIVSRNYKAWTPYYEVRENVYNPHRNFTVLTAQSHMNGLWHIILPPKVYISFSTLGEDDNDNNDNNELLKCEYEISWPYKYFGEVYRKCLDEKWIKVAQVKGSSEWGMQWFDPEGIDTYGIVTKPAYGKNKRMRNVIIRPDSPFPSIVPALYVAYYDRVINEDQANSN